MRETGRIIKTTILICACFVLFVRAGTEHWKPWEKQVSTWELVRKQQIQNSKVTESPAEEHKSTERQVKKRVLHFPINQSLGTLSVQDESSTRKIESFYHWIYGPEWEDIGEAKGDVTIPAGKRLSLTISPQGWKDLSPLSNLGPDDLYSLGFRSTKEGAKPDDRCMPHIAHLTGLKILILGNTNITARGLKLLENLSSLEQLSVPARFSDAGLAEVGRLSSLKALYINDHSLTYEGLAHLARLELLEELDLVGKGRLNDVGLVHLSKLPRLRYLLLQGKNFTDTGTIHLKNIPSLKILHLGFLTQLTDAAIVQLSQIPALERLSLHWNENITNSSMMYLTKLNSLRMLDIKHSKVTDEGLEHLAQIKSLENLTLPDGGVTDAGVEHISQLHNLKYLWAGSRSSSPLTDKSLSYISTLGNLEELHIGGIDFSDEGMNLL